MSCLDHDVQAPPNDRPEASVRLVVHPRARLGRIATGLGRFVRGRALRDRFVGCLHGGHALVSSTVQGSAMWQTVSDLIEKLEFERDYVINLEGADFLRQLCRYSEAMERDPRAAAVLAELVADAKRLLDSYSHHEEQMVPRLVELRDKFVRLAPDADDSSTEAPVESTLASPSWMASLAYFDQVAQSGFPLRIPLQATGAEDHSCSQLLSGLLGNKIWQLQFGTEENADGVNRVVEERRRPELDELREAVDRARGEHSRFHQRFVTERRTSPGFAYLEIHALVKDILEGGDPRPSDDAEQSSWFAQMLARAPQLKLLQDTLYATGTQRLSESEEESLDHLVRAAKDLVERLQHGLVSSATQIRSALRLLHRYKAWAQLYDTERLRKLADSDSRKAELLLEAEAAKFLFQEGLTPLTQVTVGRLRPDVLDVFSGDALYIETKQLNDSQPMRTIVSGAKQLRNTLGRVESLPIPVREAFLLIFRRSGPDIDLPEWYLAGRVRVYPVVIDLAETSESGSRQEHQAVVITRERLAAIPAAGEDDAQEIDNAGEQGQVDATT